MKKCILSLAIFVVLSISAFASQPLVIDAVNYEKPVITADYALETGFKQGDFGSHTVIIPKINLDTPTVQKINKEMYEIASGVYERLLNNEEYNQMYNYDYYYKEEGGVIGIVVTEYRAVQCGGSNFEYKAFYYDKRTDKQLSFKQYLSALGVNIKDLSSNSKIVREYENAGQPDKPVILDAILDSKSSIVYVETPMSMNSSMVVESSTALVKIHLNNPFELYVGKADEIVMTLGNKTAYVSGNAVQIDAEPIISNGRTMLPARFVAEKLGASVDWDASSRKVTIQKGTLKIELVVGSSVAYVNNREVTLDSPVFIQDGRTYTPVRFVAERLGAKVEWLEETKQVVIKPASLNYEVLFESFCKNNNLVDEIVTGMKASKNKYTVSAADSKSNTEIKNTFLVDLNNDLIPELCVATDGPGMDFDVFIFEYVNGNIKMCDKILENGAGGSSGWSNQIAIMDDGRARIVYNSHGSLVSEYSIYELDGNIIVPKMSYYVKFSHSENTEEYYENNIPISEETYTKQLSYYDNLIEQHHPLCVDTFRCSFAEIWEYQKSKI